MTTTYPVATTRDRSTIPGGLVAAVAGPGALAVANACFAVLTSHGHAADSRAYLALVQRHQSLVEIGSAFGLLACLLIVPAVWAVAGRLRAEAPRLASIGGWLMSSGYVMGVALSVESLIVVAVSRSSGDAGAFTDAVDHHLTLTATAMYAVFGIGALLGGLVLGLAMWRSATVPRWCGAALILSEPVRVVGLLLGVDLLTAVASVLILVAFVGTLRSR